jgi:hypothetical protein
MDGFKRRMEAGAGGLTRWTQAVSNGKLGLKEEELGEFSIRQVMRMAERVEINHTAEYWSEKGTEWPRLLSFISDFDYQPDRSGSRSRRRPARCKDRTTIVERFLAIFLALSINCTIVRSCSHTIALKIESGRNLFMAKPTIDELERILANEEEVPIEILPNGEVRAKGETSSSELGGKKPLTMRENLGGEYGGE